MYKKISLLISLFILYGSIYSQERSLPLVWENDTILATYFPNSISSTDLLPVNFLQKAEELGYNYIIVEFQLSSSTWKTGIQNKLRDLFIQADQFGLKVIPEFQNMDCHSGHWTNISSSIQTQVIPASGRILVNDPNAINDRVTAFGPDPVGTQQYDHFFNELIEVIYDAFDAAIVKANAAGTPLSYSNLDFIDIGFDEPVHRWGNAPNWQYLLSAGMCQNDINWIKSNVPSSESTQTKLVKLIANAIRRKVDSITNIAGTHGQSTRVMLFSDMFDPNHLGGYFRLWTFDDLENPTRLISVNTTSLVNEDDILPIKNNIIIKPWQYDRFTFADDINDYDTEESYDFFSNNGFQFMPTCAVNDANGPITDSRKHQIFETLNIAQNSKYKNSLAGFCAVHWGSGEWDVTKDSYDQSVQFTTMDIIVETLDFSDILDNPLTNFITE